MRNEPKPTPNRTGLATSIRVSPLGLKLWNQLAARHGLKRSAYLEMLLRQTATAEGISSQEEGHE